MIARAIAGCALCTALAAVGCRRTAQDVGWTGDDPFEVPVVTIDGDRATVELVRRSGVPLSPERVPFTAERYNALVDMFSTTLEEANVAGTGLALDIDGDGDTNDRHAVSCKDGAVGIGATSLRPAGDEAMRVLDYEGRIQRVEKNGIWALQYAPCTETSAFVGFSAADEPIEVRHTDGPVVQILAFTPVATPEAPPTFDLRASAAGRPTDAPTHETLDYEPTFGTPAWASMRWVMVPVADEARQTFEITLPAADGPIRVVAMVNLAADGKRWRMEAGGAARE